MIRLSKRQIFFNALKLVIGLCIAAILCQFPLHNLEFYGYDLLFRASPQKSFISQNIEIVAIDSKSLDHFGRAANAAEHSLALKNLQSLNPLAVIYLINPTDVQGSHIEKLRLAKEIYKTKNFMLSVPELDVGANLEKFEMPYPFDQIASFQGILSEDKVNFGGDGVSRRAILSYDERWFLHPVAAQLISGKKNTEDYRGVFDFKGSKQIFVNTKPSGSFKTWSFLDLMQNQLEGIDLRDKIVIVGQATNFDSSDFVRSVYSRDIAAMPKIEYHANIIETLIQNNGIIKSSDTITFLITALIALISVYFTFLVRPLTGIALIFITGISYIALSYIIFISFGYWLLLAHPLLALLVTYYFFIPYRLIAESKKSWQYQQKNKLLLQVEEMKNNFISMMSHDLKTPLARIQGMAEMAAVETKTLSEKQRSALSNIKSSTQELNDFISSILNLSRVETKGLSLNLESRDINQIVDEVIQKNQYQAQKKNIQIIFEPEPLFSIKMDTDLIRQAVHNLIENAVKYSPQDSSILITTEESADKIILQVSDQGIGIASEDIDKIFNKFYRASAAQNSNIKGSGVGLYLSSYFIKLHQGNILVESEPQKGSTFTLELPF